MLRSIHSCILGFSMKKKISISFVIVLLTIMLLSMFSKDVSISHSERRHLKSFPEFTFEDFFSGRYMMSIEGYLLDHTIFRDEFKSIKVASEGFIFNKSDINDFYRFDDHIVKIEYPYNGQMGLLFVEYIARIQEEYLKNNTVYVGIIPDKNYFGPDDGLKMNYRELINDVKGGDYQYIDLFDVLTMESYYKTDPHWKQEALYPILTLLSSEMDFDLPELEAYEYNTYGEFYGAYAGQFGSHVSSEELTYLSHPIFSEITVFDYERNQIIPVYDEDALDSIDPYDIFLGGASPLIEIRHEKSKTDKSLIIFRDSFGSSLTPLLMESYQSITLIDTRYVSYKDLETYVDFANQDVLFLYSTMVVNNSVMLR